jgi:hypothetical protein
MIREKKIICDIVRVISGSVLIDIVFTVCAVNLHIPVC